MSRIVIFSNRLPVTVKKNRDGGFEYAESIGGLSTGLKSYHKQAGSLWVGWPGIADDELDIAEKQTIQKTLLEEYQCLPVFLSNRDIDLYYYGFCNKTIWPLFHYFSSKTEYDFDAWAAYNRINRRFFETARPFLGQSDAIWVHDYQLMLLPGMIKEEYSDTPVGFFLHIPFPSFELFRLLIWREEILAGLLGADLIGFHTYDYVRHFLSCTRRLLGLEDNLNRIAYEDRYVWVDAFPMGIDYEWFAGVRTDGPSPEFSIDHVNDEGNRIVLSVDRLDYTKGIPQRIRAFRRFLARYPEYRQKVKLYLIVAPSREEIDTYDSLLREIKEAVSETNGRFGTLNWMPVWFFYRSFSQEQLVHLFRSSDVLLVTPLRDGMNLVAKEYIAARTDCRGMVVISETAGAASELAEAVIVNPNNYNAIAQGLKTALDMPEDEKRTRNQIMHRRLQRRHVGFWAEEFIGTLSRIAGDRIDKTPRVSLERNSEALNEAYRSAGNRILFLDYDGTLVGFKAMPEQARPDPELMSLLSVLTADPANKVVIISGRDRYILEEWFGSIDRLDLIASHGLWLRASARGEWTMTASLDNQWKESIRPILELYADRTPGSFVEEKGYSLAFHYRQCDPDMVDVKLRELRETLLAMTGSSTLMLQEGNKVLEVKDSRVNKGYIASLLIKRQPFDFVLGAGDDYTDEDLFCALPRGAYAVKVGIGRTSAGFSLKSWQSMRLLLWRFADISRNRR